MSLVEVREVSKSFDNHVALEKVSFSVPKGGVFGLLGPNGAGKTTLIRLLNQIILPDAGEIIFDGHPLRPDDVEKMAYLPEERGLYKKMKVGEQALYLARLKGLSKETAAERLHHWFSKFEMESWWDRRVEELSKGMQQKVQFVTTLLHNPQFLIFDEPFSGFDPVNANLLKQEILNLKDQGATIILSTHNMTSVEEICDEIVLLNHARKVLSGKLYDLKQQYKKNCFCLKMKGLAEDFRQRLPLKIEVLSVRQSAHESMLTLQLAPDLAANDLLAAFIPLGEISSFEELLPSMNEIFIESVR